MHSLMDTLFTGAFNLRRRGKLKKNKGSSRAKKEGAATDNTELDK